jgi:hypothetical protein
MRRKDGTMSSTRLTRIVALAAGVALIPMFVVASSCCPGHAKRSKPDTAAKSAETAVVEQTRCPVMGGKINKAQYVDVDGKRIYVCCPGCIGKIKADPAKYIKKLEDAGVTLAKAPAAQGKKHDHGSGDHAGHKH